MSFSPSLSSVFNRTVMREKEHLCPFSGMCAMCTADCIGTCEIGISAVRGKEMVYPNTTGDNQIASEKITLLAIRISTSMGACLVQWELLRTPTLQMFIT